MVGAAEAPGIIPHLRCGSFVSMPACSGNMRGELAESIHAKVYPFPISS